MSLTHLVSLSGGTVGLLMYYKVRVRVQGGIFKKGFRCGERLRAKGGGGQHCF